MTDENDMEDVNPWNETQARAFMKDLAALAKRWNVSMGACSCCMGINVDLAEPEWDTVNLLSGVHVNGPEDWSASVTKGNAYYERTKISYEV